MSETSNFTGVVGKLEGLQKLVCEGVNKEIGGLMYTAFTMVKSFSHPLSLSVNVTSKYPVSIG